MLEVLKHIDEKVFLFINHTLANGFFDLIFPVITNGTYWVIPIILVAGWFLFREKKKAIIILLLAILTVSLSDMLTVRVIKPLVARERPCDPDTAIEGGRFLIGQLSSYSFPSAHAANAFGQAMLFSVFYLRFSWIFFSVACLVGFSRIYVGVHYPLDVAGGACFGILVALTVVFIANKAIINKYLSIFKREH
jgi:undecaprenyl-diphosphatase